MSPPGTAALLHRIRDALDQGRAPLLTLRGRNRTKADLKVFEIEGSRVAVKDYGPRPWWVRHTVGRFLLRREARAYREARGLPGIVTCHGRVGGTALALQFVDSRPLSELQPGDVDPAIFDQLAAIVAAFHERGIALGDLHHRDVLIGAEGALHVVDLAGAVFAGPRPGGIFSRMCEVDLVALERLRARFTGGDVEAAPARVSAAAARRHARGRRLKRFIDRLRGRRR